MSASEYIDTFACSAVQINIVSQRAMTVEILCDGEDDDLVWSCQAMRVSLQTQGGSATIGCYKKTACESMHIDVKNEELALTVQMYENSNDVEILHPAPTAVDFVCSAPNMTRFINFPPAAELTDAQLLRLAQSEYVADVLPCDGVKIVCADNSPQRCEMEYAGVRDNLDQLVLLQESQTECYWLDITKIFVAELSCESCTDTFSSAALLSDVNDLIIVVVAVGVVACLIIVFFICCFYRKRQERIAIALQSINMKRPMVLIIGIAGYEQAPKAPEFAGKKCLKVRHKNALLFYHRLRAGSRRFGA